LHWLKVRRIMAATPFSIFILVTFATAVTSQTKDDYSSLSYSDPSYEPSYKPPSEPSYEPSYEPPYGTGMPSPSNVYPSMDYSVGGAVPKTLKTFVENHLAPHFDSLVCHGLNTSYEMHIYTRRVLGCDLSTANARVAAPGKYSACEVAIMKKFLLCPLKDMACYTATLESLGTCLNVCCKGQPEFCQAAVCKGLERSYVDVIYALYMCKDVVFDSYPIENCPLNGELYFKCDPYIIAAAGVCSQEDPWGQYTCVKNSLKVDRKGFCIPCIRKPFV